MHAKNHTTNVLRKSIPCKNNCMGSFSKLNKDNYYASIVLLYVTMLIQATIATRTQTSNTRPSQAHAHLCPSSFRVSVLYPRAGASWRDGQERVTWLVRWVPVFMLQAEVMHLQQELNVSIYCYKII